MPGLLPYQERTIANHPVNIPTEAADRLIACMYKYDVLRVAGVHKVPVIVRGVAENHRIIHPVIGAEPDEHGNFPYIFRRLAMSAERIPGGHRWNRGRLRGRWDESHVTLSMPAEAESDEEDIGMPAYVSASAENETRVHRTLDGSIGYSALRAVLSAPRRNNTRKMLLYGENEFGERETLPFTDNAADVLIGQVDRVLRKDLRLQRDAIQF